jgi:hypothetical protein
VTDPGRLVEVIAFLYVLYVVVKSDTTAATSAHYV